MPSNSSAVVSSITETQAEFAFIFAQYCTIPGAGVGFLVLVICGITACSPKSRQYLDRISFRLIIYSLIFHVLFGIAYATAPVSPGARCNFTAFIKNVLVCYSTFITTCIAINLQLVVVHHVNGLKMEKYYLIGPTLLNIAINVPAYALDQFGWNEVTLGCWYKNPNQKSRLHWMIATESFPFLLAATVETVCSCILLGYMYRVQRSTQPFFRSFILSNIKSVTPTSRNPTEQNLPENPNRVERQRRSKDISHLPRYRKAILWIILYPITSLLVNFIGVTLDLYTTIRGVDTQMEYRLLILDLCLVGLRTLPYGLLAAFDPALTNAMRELLGKNRSRAIQFVPENRQRPQTQVSSLSPQGSADEADRTQSRLNMALASGEGERSSSIVGANEKEDKVKQTPTEAEETGKELEDERQYDEYELWTTERQLISNL